MTTTVLAPAAPEPPAPIPTEPVSPNPAHVIFEGGGELGALARKKDWSATPLGPVETWPQSLRTIVSMVMTSRFPKIVLWGPELVQIYNDAYRLLMGAKHPAGLGQTTRECWPEAWHINESIYPRVFAGETLYFEERPYPLAPYGKVEEYFLTLCYNPVRDETGGVGGVVVTLVNVTSEVKARAERDRALEEARAGRERLHEVFMQAPAAITVLEGPEHRFIVANPLFQELIGARNLIGKTVREALPETEEQGFIRLLDEVFRTRTPFTAQEMLIRLDRQATGVLEDVYVDFVYQPLIGPDGASFGVMAHAVDVTEQVVARRKIEALAAERVAMLGHIADAVITMDAGGRVSFANAMAGSLYPGLEVGARVEDTVQLFRIDGSAYPPEQSPTARALRGERVLNEEWLAPGPDGGMRRVQGSAVPVRDEKGALLGTVLTARDITQQTELQHQLEFERNRLRDVFLQTPASIMVTRGREHRIEVANPLYDQMVGGRPLVGQTVPEAFPDLAGQGLFELYDQVFDTQKPFVGREARVMVQRFGRTDEAYFNFVYQPLVDANGRSFGTMTHAVEVTDMVRARQQTEERAEELVRLTEALEESNRELDQFAYVASHDLKGPLRGIANLSQWLEEDLAESLSSGAKDHLKLLRGRVHRMEALIEGILAYSRAGRVRDPVARVDTKTLVREVIELLEPSPNVKIEVTPRLPVLVAERVPLQQVFMNLIGNAVKFSVPHRGDPEVRVDVRDLGAAWEFTISDNGPGIAPQFQERIWVIFQTLESRDKVEGTGIGLTVVKKIIETRGGRISLESDEGKGATFRFTWPKRSEA